MTSHVDSGDGLARRVVDALRGRGLTLGTCESLTGGMVCAQVTTVPGASAVLRGGLVTYASDLKTSLAGVDAAHVAREGVVDAFTARAMAEGARRALGCDLAVSCTGVAGPHPQDGRPVGTVFLGIASSQGSWTRELALSGGRNDIRRQTVDEALALVLDSLWDNRFPGA